MAFSHHDASHGDQGCRSETPLLSTKHTSNGDITTGTNLTVGLDSNTSTEIVEDKGLVSLS